MAGWTTARLRRETLRRQFPAIRGRGLPAVVRAYEHLVAVQTQVPRSAHLTLASRLPGVSYATITAALEAYAVVKATTLRGTVHTSTPAVHARLAAVAVEHHYAHQATLRLGLDRLTPAGFAAEVEHLATDWVDRDELVARGLDRIVSVEGTGGRSPLADPGSLERSLVWGWPTLVRRPDDDRWDRRRDTRHRHVGAFLEVEPVAPAAALRDLVRAHLGAYGPATRRDIAWWAGTPLGAVDRAVESLADEVEVVADVSPLPDAPGDPLLDLAEPPSGGHADPGTRLLADFDGVLMGYAPVNRTRIVDPPGLRLLSSAANGLIPPIVLHDGRVRALWRMTGSGRRRDVAVHALPGEAPVPLDAIEVPLGHALTALGLSRDDVDLRPAGRHA